MARQIEISEINMEFRQHPWHLAQTVAYCDRHMGDRWMDVGWNR